ncbi:TetR/AcrR family transcriptional regulator [Sphingomonas sp. DT-204]|uniref:TetR/AcrR family transcriptional regulator n=1 Tax=Sphingomonas sp. DT-204 TaxID=3396166 RepID=UPI003F1D05E8
MRTRWAVAADHDETRAVLRKAALDQVRAHGARNLSMRRLAASLGISAMTAYRYYADKEELLRDLKWEISGRFTAALRAGAGGHADPRARLRATAVAYLEFAIGHEHEYRLMFDEWLGDVAPQSDAPARQAASWHFLIDLLRPAIPGMDDARLTEVGYFVWSTVHGLAMLHLAGRARLDRPIAEAVRPQLEMLLSLIGSSEESRPKLAQRRGVRS